MRYILYKIVNKFNSWLSASYYFNSDPSAKVTISKNNSAFSGQITVGKNSTLTIEDSVFFSGKLSVGNDCNVYIAKNCKISNITIDVKNKGVLYISSNSVFDAPERFPNHIEIDNGKAYLSENIRLQANLLVRFGGDFSMGTFSSINYSSEIRCEEKISIGEYCLMSYEVCIYDTNTHSTDWEKRRERIPHGALELKRPKTSPVIIGNDVWIGKGASILKGATIMDKSIIGIRTIVPSGIYNENSIIVSPKPKIL